MFTFVKFVINSPRLFFEILKLKFFKNKLGKFIPNFPCKHVFTSAKKILALKERLLIYCTRYVNCMVAFFIVNKHISLEKY